MESFSNVSNVSNVINVDQTSVECTPKLISKCCGLTLKTQDVFSRPTEYWKLQEDEYWRLQRVEVYSTWLKESLEKIETNGLLNCKAGTRMVIDMILIEAMGLAPNVQMKNNVKLEFESDEKIGEKLVTLTANADYAIGNDEHPQFFIVEKSDPNSITHLLCQMGISFASQKRQGSQHPMVFGLLATIFEFEFFKIDHNGVTTKTRRYQVSESMNTIVKNLGFIIGS